MSYGRLKLSTENATYSHEDLYTVLKEGFSMLNFQERKFEKVLILGFALGSAMTLLEDKYNMDAAYTGVEIDPVIVELANEYLDKEQLSKLQLQNADASVWLEQQSNQKFDLIIIDLFIDVITDQQFLSEEFLQNVASLVAPKGLLLFNRLAYDKKTGKAITSYYEQTFFHSFSKAECLIIGKNRLLVGHS